MCIRDRLYHKDGGVMFYHMVQSFPKGAAVDPRQAHEAARRLAEYFDGCEVLVCTCLLYTSSAGACKQFCA